MEFITHIHTGNEIHPSFSITSLLYRAAWMGKFYNHIPWTEVMW